VHGDLSPLERGFQVRGACRELLGAGAFGLCRGAQRGETRLRLLALLIPGRGGCRRRLG
jgi:hypothetical protein